MRSRPSQANIARRARQAIWSATIAAAAPLALLLTRAAKSDPPQPTPQHALHVVLPDAPRIATLRADGRRIIAPIEWVSRPMCFGDSSAMSDADLMNFAIESAYHSATRGKISSGDGGGIAGDGGGGLVLNFNAAPGVPPEALTALQRVQTFYQHQFSDNVTVTINLRFSDLPGNVLGATSTPYTHVSWSTSRIGLQNDMDDSDHIQSFLPPNATIPVRYNGLSAIVTQETRVFWTIANFNAALGFIAGDAGTMRFNQNINWDYDPDDGVIGYSFIDVVTHEVGHVLGFDSGADFREKDMEALDIFRFQRSDGGAGHDYNPDTYQEFAVTPRTVSYNLPNNNAISDIIVAEYHMSDGFPYQASHFKDEQPPIGIMDPVLGQGETFAPHFFTAADKRMFDAIGWDR